VRIPSGPENYDSQLKAGYMNAIFSSATNNVNFPCFSDGSI